MRHIRKSNANVTDHRFRSVVSYQNKPRPTLCGAEPTAADHSRKSGIRLIEAARVRPDWLVDVCPECVKALSSKVDQ